MTPIPQSAESPSSMLSDIRIMTDSALTCTIHAQYFGRLELRVETLKEKAQKSDPNAARCE
jgi:hypothetical protein